MGIETWTCCDPAMVTVDTFSTGGGLLWTENLVDDRAVVRDLVHLEVCVGVHKIEQSVKHAAARYPSDAHSD